MQLNRLISILLVFVTSSLFAVAKPIDIRGSALVARDVTAAATTASENTAYGYCKSLKGNTDKFRQGIKAAKELEELIIELVSDINKAAEEIKRLPSNKHGNKDKEYQEIVEIAAQLIFEVIEALESVPINKILKLVTSHGLDSALKEFLEALLIIVEVIVDDIAVAVFELLGGDNKVFAKFSLSATAKALGA